MDDDERTPGAPEWAVTFGDMMSLLLTFFILLLSMSEFKQEGKYQNVLDSMRLQFGQEATMASFLPRSSLTTNATTQSLAAKGRAKRSDILNGGSPVKSPQGDDALVRTIRSASVKAAGGVLFFAESGAALTNEAKQHLRAIAAEIADKPQRIEVRGHASRNPATDSRNHWTLASERAGVVKDYLIELGIGPQRIRLSSAGDNEPLDNKFDIEGRQRNARVEVLLWDESVTLPNDPE
jgi:chemotaxis protein MotB